MICVFVAGIALAFAQYKVTPVMPQIMSDLSVDRVVGGWILSIFTLIGIFMAFPAVNVIKKWGIKVGGLAALIFALVGGIIGLFASGQWPLIISRVIEGFGLGLIGVIAPSAISMWFPIAKRAAPMGLWSSWQMVGISFSFFLGLPIANAFGDWKGLWIVSLGILVVALVLSAVVVKKPL
jgi:MFS family permease